MMIGQRVLVGISVLAVLVVSPALAEDYTWLAGNGLWSDTAKWDLGAVPGAGDTAIFNGAASTVALDNGATIGSILFQTSCSGNQLLDYTSSIDTLRFDTGDPGVASTITAEYMNNVNLNMKVEGIWTLANDILVTNNHRANNLDLDPYSVVSSDGTLRTITIAGPFFTEWAASNKSLSNLALVVDGQLRLSNGSALGNDPTAANNVAVTVNSGGVLRAHNANSINGNVTVGAGGFLQYGQSAGLTGIGAVTINSGGGLWLENAGCLTGTQVTGIGAGGVVRMDSDNIINLDSACSDDATFIVDAGDDQNAGLTLNGPNAMLTCIGTASKNFKSTSGLVIGSGGATLAAAEGRVLTIQAPISDADPLNPGVWRIGRSTPLFDGDATTAQTGRVLINPNNVGMANGLIDNDIVLDGGSLEFYGASGSNFQVDGQVTGSGELKFSFLSAPYAQPGGEVVLTDATNDFVGTLALGRYNPQLVISDPANLGDPGNLIVTEPGHYGFFKFTNSMSLGNDMVFSASVGIDTGSNDVVLSGDISAPENSNGSQIKTGSGKLTLTGNNSFGGWTQTFRSFDIVEGTLSISQAANLGPYTYPKVAGGTLEITGSFAWDSRGFSSTDPNSKLDVVGSGTAFSVASPVVFSIGAQDALTKIGDGTFTIDAAQQHGALGDPNTAVLRVAAGTVNINTDSGPLDAADPNLRWDNLVLDVTGGAVNLNADQHLRGLEISAGQVDIQAGDVVINYAVSGASPVAEIAADVNAGLLTSTASATQVLGYVDLTAQQQMLIRLTFGGDANVDGKVDVSDLGILAGNWGTLDGSAYWFTGDFSRDGNVDVSDLGILAGNWGSGAGVPEPTSLALLAMAGLAVVRRRR